MLVVVRLGKDERRESVVVMSQLTTKIAAGTIPSELDAKPTHDAN